MTALMLLTFNGLQNPHNEKLSSDNNLVDTGLRMLDRIVEDTQSEVVCSFRDACGTLNQESRRRRAEASVMASSFDLSAYLIDL
jgi:hypothetical protein